MASVQAMLHRRPALRLAGLLTPALLWLGLFYLLPLGFLLATAFFATDSFTGRVLYTFTTENVVEVLTNPAYLLTAVRTVGVAVGVTALCVVLAVPLAAYMALVAGPRARPVLVALVVTPLWASYLVKGYAWRVLLAPEGPLGGLSPGYGWVAVVLTLTYLWLPYMILPIYAGIDGMRGSYVDAAAGPSSGTITVRNAVHGRAPRSAAPTRCWATSCTPTSPPTCRSPRPSRSCRCW